MGDFEHLAVWKRAHRLTLALYKVTAHFPASERYGLTSQIRRAAASVPANIAEGCGRNSDAELARFCRISLGSANELSYHLLLARDLGYLPPDLQMRASREIQELRAMLSGLTARLIADS